MAVLRVFVKTCCDAECKGIAISIIKPLLDLPKALNHVSETAQVLWIKFHPSYKPSQCFMNNEANS